jgi:formylglycine-generating enzyme required for sulfatase activity
LPTSTSNLLSKPTPEGKNLPTVGGNLVLNPSFDLGTTYSPDYWAWLPYTGACSKMVYNDPANAHTSPNFLATGLSDDYPECQSVYQDIPASVTSGDSYTMSVWLKSPWQPQTISFVLEWTGGISPIVTNQVVNLTDTWQCFQTILDIPDPGDNTKFRVLVNLPNNNLDVDIDDVLLLKGKYQSCPFGSGPPEIPATPQIGSELVSPSDGMNLVYVPEGEFSMGIENGLLGVTPQNVYLAAFWIDKTEVTNGMYAICVNAGTCQPPSDLSSSTRSSYFGNPQYTDYPVINVSWNDAQSYCAWAGRRLPTEAEWEKAARGPDGRMYPWGNNEPTCSLANTNIDVQGNCVGDTRAAGTYPAGASPYGALDMTGNVSEWSVYEVGETVNAPPAPSTPGGSSGIFTAVRGGSWSTNEYTIRPIHRYKYTTTYAENDFGIRCALSP